MFTTFIGNPFKRIALIPLLSPEQKSLISTAFVDFYQVSPWPSPRRRSGTGGPGMRDRLMSVMMKWWLWNHRQSSTVPNPFCVCPRGTRRTLLGHVMMTPWHHDCKSQKQSESRRNGKSTQTERTVVERRGEKMNSPLLRTDDRPIRVWGKIHIFSIVYHVLPKNRPPNLRNIEQLHLPSLHGLSSFTINSTWSFSYFSKKKTLWFDRCLCCRDSDLWLIGKTHLFLKRILIHTSWCPWGFPLYCHFNIIFFNIIFFNRKTFEFLVHTSRNCVGWHDCPVTIWNMPRFHSGEVSPIMDNTVCFVRSVNEIVRCFVFYLTQTVSGQFLKIFSR